MDRRHFLRIAASSLGAGALYRVAPAWATSGPAVSVSGEQARRNGEAVTPFTFVQLSDTHVGFAGPPNPTGTLAFERAVERVNALPERPELVLFTGDLTHESEVPGEHEKRMRRFKEIAGQLQVARTFAVPGEHDAGLDGGALFRASFGETSYAFDHRGVHFVAIDNVSRAQAGGGARADRLAEAGPRPLHPHHPDRRVHPSSALRPQARVGVVHARRRRGHGGPGPLRERDGPLRPHPPRGRAPHPARVPPGGPVAHLRVPRSGRDPGEEADPLRPRAPVPEPRPAGRERGKRGFAGRAHGPAQTRSSFP